MTLFSLCDPPPSVVNQEAAEHEERLRTRRHNGIPEEDWDRYEQFVNERRL